MPPPPPAPSCRPPPPAAAAESTRPGRAGPNRPVAPATSYRGPWPDPAGRGATGRRGMSWFLQSIRPPLLLRDGFAAKRAKAARMVHSEASIRSRIFSKRSDLFLLFLWN
ncbi:hypothetical protein BS78_08G096500 [Paspalum vaginatum]|nr:hypothetical protein BS78_08G096500 [Paspalum vaginatum]